MDESKKKPLPTIAVSQSHKDEINELCKLTGAKSVTVARAVVAAGIASITKFVEEAGYGTAEVAVESEQIGEDLFFAIKLREAKK